MDGGLPQSSVNAHFDAEASTYGEKSAQGLWNAVRRKEYEAVLAEMLPMERLNVLEVGCGSGFYAENLVRHKPSVYIATDRLFSMTRAVATPGVKKAVADLAGIPAKPVFDRILCAGALEFFPDPPGFFAEAASALKDGGKIVLLTPSSGIAGRLYRLWHSRHGFTINLFSESSLRELAAAAGLKIDIIRRAAIFNWIVSFTKC